MVVELPTFKAVMVAEALVVVAYRKSEAVRLSSLSALKAAGTAPIILRGDISPSLATLTPRYKVWLKSTEASEVTEPSMTLNKPAVEVTLCVSVQIAVPPDEAV